MNNLVEKLVKVDLHIHSCASEKKDGNKVSNNTIDKIETLIEKLRENKVEMIAITDHNNFDIDIYNKIKLYEGNGISKLLPGIEFDVELNTERIHIITIFNDNDYKKIEQIPQKIIVPFDNTNKNAYTEKTFKEILKNIDLSVLLIAHQKSGIKAENQNENLAKIGENEFDSIIGIDYFDAVEFRSGKVEGILNDYKYEKQLSNLRYITGTDCHVWDVYPKQDENDKTDIRYCYIKSLPTFKGLVMALTEPRRITTAPFEISKPFIEKIELNINGLNNDINLSSGLNVIIGDNSIGKSLMLETLIEPAFSRIKEKAKKDGYKSYIKSRKIKIKSFSKDELKRIQYDYQGGIREKFQSGTKLLDIQLFKDKFKKLDTTDDYSEIYSYVDNLLKCVDHNQEVFDRESELDFDIQIPSEVENSTYLLRIVDDLENKSVDYSIVSKKIKSIIKSLKELCDIEQFSDSKIINSIIKTLEKLLEKYDKKMTKEIGLSKVRSIIKSICKKFEDKNKEVSETQENKLTVFRQNIISASDKVKEYIKISNKEVSKTLSEFKPIVIKAEIQEEGKYKFITSTAYKIIDEKEINAILTKPLSNITSIDKVEKLTATEFEKKLKKTLKDDGENSRDKYKNAVSEYIKNKILKQDLSIYCSNQKLEQGNSPGKNALIYLDVLADESSKKLYIVDQPGDDISHTKLKTEVIEILRRMGEAKQVIFITHKPELVVNLDVDNVIILKEENSNLRVINGTLEYEDKNSGINILKEVAEILDGGEETIRKRWKRYDK